MTQSSKIKDLEENLIHIREVSEDKTKSELYTAKDNLWRRITEDFKDEKVGIADHYRNGITREYKVRKGLSRVFLGEKGEEKPESAKQKREPWEGVLPEPLPEEPVREETSYKQGWSQEKYVEVIGAIGNYLRACDEEEREEREFKESLKRIESEQWRKKVHFLILDKLYDMPDSELEEKASYRNCYDKERNTAILLQTIREINEERLISWGQLPKYKNNKEKPEDEWEYFIIRRLEDIESRKKLEAKGQLEKLLTSNDEERYLFLKNNPNHTGALELIRTIEDPKYLVQLYKECISNQSRKEIEIKLTKIQEEEKIANTPWILRVIDQFIFR